jgi:hypothetical protein
VAVMTIGLQRPSKLINYKFDKVEAEIFREVPKIRAPVQIRVKTLLGANKIAEEGMRHVLNNMVKVEVSVTGLPAPDSDNTDPIFKILVAVQGVYEFYSTIAVDTLEADSYPEECAASLYALAVGEIDCLAAKLMLPRIQVPLVMPIADKALKSEAPTEPKPQRKVARKSVAKKV